MVKTQEGTKFRTKFLPSLRHGCAASKGVPKTVGEADVILKQAEGSATLASQQLGMDDNGFNGSVWDVVIIEAGMSLNGQTFPAAALVASSDIFEGVPIYSFVWQDTLRHMDKNVQKQMGGNVFGNLVGQIRNVRWDESRRSLVGQAFIDCPNTRQVLLNQWKRLDGKLMAGLSIDAEGFEVNKRVTRMVRANSVDLVTHPAAGGRFERLVAEVVDLIQAVEFCEEKWDGDKSRFTLDQLMNAVPQAVQRSASLKAEAESREVTKEDLDLVFREPDGRVNVNALRAALSDLKEGSGVVNLTEEVSKEAEEEIHKLLAEFDGDEDKSGLQEAVNNQENPVKLNELMSVLQSGLKSADGWPESVKAALKEALKVAGEKETKVAESVPTDKTPEVSDTPPTTAPTAPVAADSVVSDAMLAPIKQNVELENKLSVLKQQLADAVSEKETAQKEAAIKVQEAAAKFKEQAIKHELDNLSEELNVVDTDTVAQLMDVSAIEVDDDGKVTGLKESLVSLLESKPFLVKKADPRGQSVNVKESVTEEEPHQALIARMGQLKSRIKAGDTRAIAEGRRIRKKFEASL